MLRHIARLWLTTVVGAAPMSDNQAMDIGAVLWLVGFLVFVVVLWRLALWADDRGWIMVRKKHGRKGLGVGMMSIAQIYSPSIEHVVDEVWSEQTRAEQDEQGEGEPGDSS